MFSKRSKAAELERFRNGGKSHESCRLTIAAGVCEPRGVTTRPDNLASRRVIEVNGGVLYEEFVTPAAVGGHVEVRYRVAVLGETVREQEKAPRDLKRDS